MNAFWKFKLRPIIISFVIAVIIMLVLEYINSLIYPFPEDMNKTDIVSVRAFTMSLPWTAYILVIIGWIVASFKAGCVSTYLSKEEKHKISLISGLLFFVFIVLNNQIIGVSSFFNVLAIIIIPSFTYIGHRYMIKIIKKRAVINNL